MPRPTPTPRLNIPAYKSASFFTVNGDSSSPYPPSSPSIADSDDDASTTSTAGLRTSIATLSDAKLRAILIKLADSNPRFQRAIAKEVAYAQTFDESSPTTPTNHKMRKSHRPRPRTSRKDTSAAPCNRKRKVIPTDVACEAEYVYHPGHLEDEVYEFLSRSPDDVAIKVVRTITMWSCCDEDEWSPGCMAEAGFTLPVEHCEYSDKAIEFVHPDVFPDSDLERCTKDTFRIPGMHPME